MDSKQINKKLVKCYSSSDSASIFLLCDAGFAFVYFEDERDADDAIRSLDNMPFGYDRRRLSVEWAKVIIPDSMLLNFYSSVGKNLFFFFFFSATFPFPVLFFICLVIGL